jgi:predicted dehydrogenase
MHIDDLIKQCDLKNKIIMIDHTFCYHPAVEKIKTLDIGTPKYYDSCRISLGLFQSDVDALLDLAVHDAAIIDYLWPDLELESRDIIKNYHVNDKANQVIVNLKFVSGFTATINCNWVSPVKKRQIIITGDRNSVVYDDIDIDKIKIYSTGQINTDYNANQLGDMIAPKVATTEALAVARYHFLQCLQTRIKPRTSIHRTHKIMKWLL